ncbi:MAG: peptide chain release factor 1 [Patescibacteria group bacterium]|mgnify:CR=1 FL=1
MNLPNLKNLRDKLVNLERELQSPEILSSSEKLVEISREYNKTKEFVDLIEKIENIKQKIEELDILIKTEKEPEFIEMAKNEKDFLFQEKNKTEGQLKDILSGKNTTESRNVIMEIRAGTGGDEASLFAANLFRMYNLFAEHYGWRTEILSANRTTLYGFKEVIFKIEGKNVYKYLKYESGVHRVQRIPETEKNGRIHTSTATVAVLPEATDIDVKIKNEDLQIETFRAGGHGGQNVQKVETAVRITHLPTGLVVSCQDERSQFKNKEKAFKILQSRLLAMMEEKKHKERSEERRSQIGSAERCEKIRTYNFPQDRITDHRFNLNWHNINDFMDGNIQNAIEQLQKLDEDKRSANLV